MRWEMEEVDGVLQRVWGLHDKVSDAIHAISRAHFLRSVKPPRGARDPTAPPAAGSAAWGGDDGKEGFVFVKDFGAEEDGAAMAEARSLGAIRSALENLEHQLEFFHTVQSQRPAERDAAIARLEQSRIILAMRLADHRGKKYRVIEEALAFVGDVHDACCFVTPENLHENDLIRSQSGKKSKGHQGGTPSMLMQMSISILSVAKNSFRLVRIHGGLGNAAMFAVSMLAFLQLNQVAFKGGTMQMRDQTSYRKRNGRSFSQLDNPSHSSQFMCLVALSARG